jgi:hypothetical protein
VVAGELHHLPTGEAAAVETTIGVCLQVAGVDVNPRHRRRGRDPPASQVNPNFIRGGLDSRVLQLPQVDQRQIVLTAQAGVERVDFDTVEEDPHAAEATIEGGHLRRRNPSRAKRRDARNAVYELP